MQVIHVAAVGYLTSVREVSFTLTREANDHIAADRDTGNFALERCDDFEIARTIVRTAHRAQNRVRARLQWQVQITTYTRCVFPHERDDVLGHHLRLQRGQPEARKIGLAENETQQIEEILHTILRVFEMSNVHPRPVH